MPVWKRFKGKKIKHGSKDYAKATWIAEGTRNGEYYKKALPDAKTRDDAEREEAEIIAKICAGEFAYYKKKTTFRSYVDEVYLPYVQTNNRSWKNNKQYILERLKDYYGDTPLKHITRAKCEQFKQWRMIQKRVCQKCTKYKERCFRCQDKPKKCWFCRKKESEIIEHRLTCNPETIETSTVNRDLGVLSNILSLAVVDGELKENPMRFVKNLEEPESRDRILTTDEKRRLFATLEKDSQLWAIVLVAITTGWRRGRILAVEKEHLDERTQSVKVKRSKREKAKLMPVSEFTWAILQMMAEAVESGHLFRARRTGKPLKSFDEAWWRVLEEAGIENFRFHDLRRAFATDSLDRGENVFTIRDALGHAKIETTQIYAMVKNEHLRDMLNKQGEEYRDYLM